MRAGDRRASVITALLCVVIAACDQSDVPESTARSHAARVVDVFSAADRASFRRLAARLPGREGVSVSAGGPDRRVQRLGSVRTGAAWSTAKVPVAMAVIDAGVGRSADVRKAITASDNAAAERLWAALGGGRRAARAATAQLRAGGDRQTEVQSVRVRPGYTPFGQTLWSLSAQARFTRGMACLRAGRRVLELMGRVVGGQRWGLGSAGRATRFKGGWGPDDAGRYLVRQMGVLEPSRGRSIAVTVAAIPADGSFDTGTRSLTRIARWAVRHADGQAADPPRCS
jgi:hypothetical protein